MAHMLVSVEFVVLGGLISAIVSGVIGYCVGDNRGRGALGFWCGFLLPVIGILIVALAADERQRCRHCKAPMDQSSARMCPKCGGLLRRKNSGKSAMALRDPVDQWEEREARQRMTDKKLPPL